MTRFVYVLPAGPFRWEVRCHVDDLIEDVAIAISPSRDCECTLDSDLCDQCIETAKAAVRTVFPPTPERLLYRRKAHALIAARAIAIVIGGEVQPHDRRGRIQDPDSYGGDSPRRQG